MAKVGELVGKTTLASYLNRFGFGRTTGLGFPGESEGIVPALSNWSDATLATISYGQGVSVTPLQMASVYATVANGGVWVRPRLVSGTVDGSGTFTPAPASPTKRVLAAADGVDPRADARLRGRGRYRDQRADPRVSGRRQDRDGAQAGPDRWLLLGPVHRVVHRVPARPGTRASWSPPSSMSRATMYGGVAAAPLFQQVARYAIQRLGIPTAPPVAPPPHVLGQP